MRAVIVEEGRLLLVNAYPGGTSDLWCAPGGGAERGASLTDNLVREVHEETGLSIRVGAPCLVNEFHDPASGFHQVEVFFRCKIVGGTLAADWKDSEEIVDRWLWAAREDVADLRVKPDSLAAVAWGKTACRYDPLELLQS